VTLAMTEAMKLMIAFVLIERPDLDEVSAEFAINEVIREKQWSTKQIEIDNAIEFLGALRERVKA
jgi:hypothetical protein